VGQRLPAYETVPAGFVAVELRNAAAVSPGKMRSLGEPVRRRVAVAVAALEPSWTWCWVAVIA
jgi:hypothetical protein